MKIQYLQRNFWKKSFSMKTPDMKKKISFLKTTILVIIAENEHKREEYLNFILNEKPEKSFIAIYKITKNTERKEYPLV